MTTKLGRGRVLNPEQMFRRCGVAMSSPLGPTLANAFLIYQEKDWLEHCPLEYRPLYYRRYVDNIFVLFNSAEHPKRFQRSRHLNISSETTESPFLTLI